MRGKPDNNLLDDFHVVQGISKGFGDFPTQNSETLLRFLILSSSKRNGIVLLLLPRLWHKDRGGS